MALDADRGLVFFPTGSASYDFNGEDRHGANLYTNSCAEAWDKNKVYNDGPYTPLGSEGTTLWFPSTIGGPNWGGASYNPTTGYLFVNLMNLGALGKLVKQPEGAPYSQRFNGSSR